MRVVERAASEGSALFDALIALDSSKPAAERKVHQMLSKAPLFLVIEYLPAIELANRFPPLSAEWSQQVFGANPNGMHVSLNDGGKMVLRFLGSVLAFDMLVNNFDRLPCIWSNAGNPGNIMFSDNGEPIAIDNMPCCLQAGVESQKQVLEEYMERVKRLARSVAASPDTEHQDFKRVRDFLRDGAKEGHGWIGLNIDIGVEGTLAVQNGFLQCIRSIVGGAGGEDESCERLTQKELQGYVDDLLDLLPASPVEHKGVGHCIGGFEAICPGFSARVVDAFSDALQEAAATAEQGRPRGDTGSTDFMPLEVVMPAGPRCRQRALLRFRSQSVSMEAPDAWQQKLLVKLGDRKANLMGALARSSFSMGRLTMHARADLQNAWAVAAGVANGQGRAGEETGEAKELAGGFFRLDQLACPKPWPAGVDPARRQDWLSPVDFHKAFGMDRESFAKLRPWQQSELKKKANLF